MFILYLLLKIILSGEIFSIFFFPFYGLRLWTHQFSFTFILFYLYFFLHVFYLFTCLYIYSFIYLKSRNNCSLLKVIFYNSIHSEIEEGPRHLESSEMRRATETTSLGESIGQTYTEAERQVIIRQPSTMGCHTALPDVFLTVFSSTIDRQPFA